MPVDKNQVIDDAADVAKVAVDVPKPFFKSKRFWLAVVSAGLHYTGYLPAPAAAAIPVIGNIVFPLIDQAIAKRQ